jgi:hypothetical protein
MTSAAGWLQLQQLRVLLVQGNPVATQGGVSSVRAMQQLAASVRSGRGKSTCDWQFQGMSDHDPTQQQQQQQISGHPFSPSASVAKALLSTADVLAAAVSASAQYDLMPREVCYVERVMCDV